MKYIKTFENYDSDQESQNPEDVIVDVKSKITRRYGRKNR
jgi:hypothetical protein